MTVQIKFESNQGYQTEAIEAVTDIFAGLQPGSLGQLVGASHHVVDEQNSLFQDLVFANRIPGSIEFAELVQANVRRVQGRKRNINGDEYVPIVPEDIRNEFVSDEFPMDYSIEMETGTGKTYVYLRTAIELYLQFGLSKFVIVVPSVAIREGVISSLRLMKEHFKELYSGIQYDSYVYDSKNVNKLRQFATSSHLQILVMNIAAFNSDDNIIRRQSDTLNGQAPIDFIQAVHPVVIMDEPQKLSGANATKAIADLNSAFRLRYSATHKDVHHLLYRLTPIDAYDLRLVKRIDVLSVTADQNNNVPLVTVKKISNTAGSITATLLINKSGGRSETQITARRNTDLQEESKLQVYQGWVVEDILANTEDTVAQVVFQNGRILREGSSTGIDEDAWQRARIRAAILDHFNTEMLIRQHVDRGNIQPIKALTLFFIDRVANYAPQDGKFRTWFEEEYLSVCRESKFRNLDKPDVKLVHDGYFAQSKQGAKDSTERGGKDDESAYDLIMKDKEKLLSFDTPLRFIFSHSALAEGWDNPNVFTICNLQNVQSEVKRRQQVGRGLRLPVMADGGRCRVEEVNHLTVIASEEFEDYVKKLQQEMKDEAGVDFANRVGNKTERVENKIKKNFKEIPLFQELWEKISPKTTYKLDFSTDVLVAEAVRRLKNEDKIIKPKFNLAKQGIDRMSLEEGLVGGHVTSTSSASMDIQIEFPDILTDICNEVPVSRATAKRVIDESGRLEEAKKNPAQFAAQVSRSLHRALAETLKNHDGIAYTPVGDSYSMEFFLNESLYYERNLIEVQKSIYDRIPVDSNVEREFAMALDARDDIELFVKLPDWYKIKTPVGGYNPDWAIVRNSGEGEYELFLVRETKGSSNIDDLFREAEAWKVTFGKKHYDALGVDYKVVRKASELDSDDSPSFVESELDSRLDDAGNE
jgi:type III restriction enzyme